MVLTNIDPIILNASTSEVLCYTPCNGASSPFHEVMVQGALTAVVRGGVLQFIDQSMRTIRVVPPGAWANVYLRPNS
jgi:hypothetical protein